MFRTFSRRVRRLALAAMLTAVSSVSTTGTAGDFDSPSRVRSGATPCYSEYAETEELCGWVGPATHDSCPMSGPDTFIETKADQPNESLAATVTAGIIATTGVKWQQIAEPFAMVRSGQADRSVIDVAKFQSWCDAALVQAESIQARDRAEASEADIQRRIESIATMEPIDVNPDGISVSKIATASPAIEIRPIDPLVGSSAVVMTIAEEYLPYDLASRDIEGYDLDIRDFLPPVSSPATQEPIRVRQYQVRSRADASVPMWSDGDDAFAWTEPVTAPVTQSVTQADTIGRWADELKTSPECLLEEVVWNVRNVIPADPFAAIGNAEALGRSLAAVVSRLPSLPRVEAEIGNEAPQIAQPQIADEPSAAGLKLLARAGIESVSQPICTIANSDETERR